MVRAKVRTVSVMRLCVQNVVNLALSCFPFFSSKKVSK